MYVVVIGSHINSKMQQKVVGQFFARITWGLNSLPGSCGCNKNPIEDWSGFSPLHFAAEKGFNLICRFILEDIDNIDELFHQNSELETPFYLAAEHGHIEVCQMIIEKLVEKYPDDTKKRETLLHLPEYSDKIAIFEAAKNGHISVCSLILEHVEDKNPKDTNGDTFLHIASIWWTKMDILLFTLLQEREK